MQGGRSSWEGVCKAWALSHQTKNNKLCPVFLLAVVDTLIDIRTRVTQTYGFPLSFCLFVSSEWRQRIPFAVFLPVWNVPSAFRKSWFIILVWLSVIILNTAPACRRELQKEAWGSICLGVCTEHWALGFWVMVCWFFFF